MDAIEKRARELLAFALMEKGEHLDAAHALSGDMDGTPAHRAIIAAVTPPEGYVLVPVEPTEPQWGGLARDVIMWMECYRTRSASSLLQHLRLCGTEIPSWLRQEVKGGNRSLDKGTVAAIIYKAMLAARPEVPNVND